MLFNDFPALKMEDVPVAAVMDAAALEDLMQQVEREREKRRVLKDCCLCMNYGGLSC